VTVYTSLTGLDIAILKIAEKTLFKGKTDMKTQWATPHFLLYTIFTPLKYTFCFQMHFIEIP